MADKFTDGTGSINSDWLNTVDHHVFGSFSVDIPEWNMVSFQVMQVPHTITDLRKVSNLSIVIYADAFAGGYAEDWNNDATGFVQVRDNEFIISRTLGGYFDSAGFSTLGSNRGIITYTIEP